MDGLKVLLDTLAARGLRYKAVPVQTNAVVDLPALDATGGLITVGFTDYDAVLARTDLPASELKISDVAMEHFNLVLPFTVNGQTIPFLRGWISLQANVRGKQYKFVTAHLETFSPDIQAEQTSELLAGPLNSELPVVLAVDLNSDANQLSWANGPATPRQRIDLILTRGDDLKGKAIVRTGLSSSIRGVWGSDHAGVFGKLVVHRRVVPVRRSQRESQESPSPHPSTLLRASPVAQNATRVGHFQLSQRFTSAIMCSG